MKAMVCEGPGQPLRLVQRPRPKAGQGEVVVKVKACGVCRTDLHLVDGELPQAIYPVVPGHEIIGEVIEIGDGVDGLSASQRVGIPWLGGSCGHCRYCREDRENLCDAPTFTGCQVDGGYAEYARARADFCFPVPDAYGDVEAAPLMCAGLIGFRALRMAGTAPVLGIYGFGAAAHIVAQLAIAEGRRILAFTRPGDTEGQVFARAMGAAWAGPSDATPPVPLDAALIFAPVGALVPAALRAVRKGGSVVCAGIHMSDIPGFAYRDLWEERRILSVANLTRADGRDFFERLETVRVQTRTTVYPLEGANRALDDLRRGRLTGAAVLVPGTRAQV
jgi:alcohol dehydrogenase, propanol-preferring